MVAYKDLDISLNYGFSSVFGPMYGARYVESVFINICCTKEDEKEEVIGKAVIKMLFLEEAENNGWNLVEVLDTYEYTFRHAQEFFDFDEMDFNSKIFEHYNHEVLTKNACIIENLEILPAYRGLGIGQKVIKDIILHYGLGGTIFIVQPYPLQFEVPDGKPSDWKISLELANFEQNKIKAFKRLTAFYESCGFEKIKGIKDILFFNPIFKSERFDKIDLEE